MKLHVMYDQSGRIVAAVRLDADAKQSRREGVAVPVRPVLKRGHASADLDVPAEHSHLAFHEACQRLMVDTSGDKHYLKARPR